jgi:hypothetical protein
MTKGRLSQLFDLDVGDKPPTGTRGLSDSLPLPSLNDRVNFYLRGIYGIRDFTDQELSDARNEILNAMAADVGTKPQTNFPKGEHFTVEGKNTDEIEAISSLAQELAGPQTVGVRASKSRAALAQAYEDLSSPAERSVAASYRSRLAPDLYASAAPEVPLNRPSRTWGYRIRGPLASVAVALAIAAIIVISPTWFSVEPNPPPTVVAQYPSSKNQTAPMAQSSAVLPVEPHLSPPAVIAQYPVPSMLQSPPAVQLEATSSQSEAGLVVRLLKLGNELIATGNVSAARLVLKEAADEGNAAAALALGATFDPVEIEKLGRSELSPDVALARMWYEKARGLGSAEAADRLKRLAGRNR